MHPDFEEENVRKVKLTCMLHTRNEMHTRYVTRHIQLAAWWTSSSTVVAFHESDAVIQDSGLTYLLRDSVLTRFILVLRRSVMVSRHIVYGNIL